jgi:hypothetical protein
MTVVVHGDGAGNAKAAEGRAKRFKDLPVGERKKINQAADDAFWARTGTPQGTLLDPAKRPSDRKQAELWNKVRDQLLKMREQLGALPEGVRATMGDPSQYTPEQYQQLLRIGRKLDSLSPEDLQMFRVLAHEGTADLEVFEKSVDQFIAIKDKYRQALEANAGPASKSEAPERSLDEQLNDAWSGFDESGFSGMTRGQKIDRARSIAHQRAAAQLKYMATHPGETAVGIVKSLSPGQLADGISQDIKDFKDSESSWGKWAAGTGIGSKASGWLAGIAAVAYVAMWLIPGVNLATAMGTAIAVAMGAGLAAVVLSGASYELHVEAAGAAKTPGEYRRQTDAAGREMATFVMGVATLALAWGAKLLGRIGFVQRNLNIGRALNNAKVRAWGAVGVDALKAVRSEAVAAIEGELSGLKAELEPARAEVAALRKQIEATPPADLMRRIATDPGFAQQLGLSPEEAKAFGPAADGPLAEKGAPQAKAKLLEAMDDGSAEAEARVQRFEADVRKIIGDLQGADSQTAFDDALKRAQAALAPEEQARISGEAAKAYQDRKIKAAVDALEAEAAKLKTSAASPPASGGAGKSAVDVPAQDPAGPKPDAAPKSDGSPKAAAPPEDAYARLGRKLKMSDAAVERMRAAKLDPNRIEELITRHKQSPERAVDNALREPDLAQALRDAGLAKTPRQAGQLARWAADADMIDRVDRLLGYAKAKLYLNPAKLPEMIEKIGKGSLNDLQAVDDALSRLGHGHMVELEGPGGDVVDHSTSEALQHKRVSGAADKTLYDNIQSAVKQLAGVGGRKGHT